MAMCLSILLLRLTDNECLFFCIMKRDDWVGHSTAQHSTT